MTEANPTEPQKRTEAKAFRKERMSLDKAMAQLGQVERPLFVGKEIPNSQNRKFEQPWHSAAITMRALGASVNDIARDLGLSNSAVSLALQTDWVQVQLRAKLEAADRNVLDVLQSEMFKNIETLVAIRDDEKVSANTRANIANSLLDRVLGKASQKIEMSTSQGGDPVAEAQLLKEQIARDAEKLGFPTARVAAGTAAGSEPGN